MVCFYSYFCFIGWCWRVTLSNLPPTFAPTNELFISLKRFTVQRFHCLRSALPINTISTREERTIQLHLLLSAEHRRQAIYSRKFLAVTNLLQKILVALTSFTQVFCAAEALPHWNQPGVYRAQLAMLEPMMSSWYMGQQLRDQQVSEMRNDADRHRL